MDQETQTKPATVVYETILGRNPNEGSIDVAIVVTLVLPEPGEHGFKFIDAKKSVNEEYFHYGYKMSEKCLPVNVHVYGDRRRIEAFAEKRILVRCELELVVKRITSVNKADAVTREFILVNLYLTHPMRYSTHEFGIVPAPQKRPWFVYTTHDMKGIGIAVPPL